MTPAKIENKKKITDHSFFGMYQGEKKKAMKKTMKELRGRTLQNFK